MKTLFLTIALAISLGLAARAAQIGDEVHSNVSLADRVDIANNQVSEVTHITLDDGVWAVSGQVQFFEGFLRGTAVCGGNIGLDVALSVDGTTLFQSSSAPDVFVGLGLPSRTIEIDSDGTDVFLVGYSISTPQDQRVRPQAWGFISARKIRNNH